MTRRMEFYNERKGILARYGIEGSSPSEALHLGWQALLADHPSAPGRARLSLFQCAQRTGGQDASGWALCRIVTGGV